MNRNNSYIKLKVFTFLIILIAFITDVVFGTMKYPVYTLIVCVIVFIYVFISPYIRISR